MGQCTKNKNLLVSLKNYANLGGGGGTKTPQKHCCLMQFKCPLPSPDGTDHTHRCY